MMLLEVLRLMLLSGFLLPKFWVDLELKAIPHVIAGNLHYFFKTSPFNLFHDFIVGNYPILMEQNLRKKFTQI